MNKTIKKILFIIIIILFIASLSHDLTTGTFPNATSKEKTSEETAIEESSQDTNTTDSKQSNKRYEVIQYEVKAGETVLSILEILNENGPPVTINQMLEDFEGLNDQQNPHQIQTNTPYYFPVYRQIEKDM